MKYVTETEVSYTVDGIAEPCITAFIKLNSRLAEVQGAEKYGGPEGH